MKSTKIKNRLRIAVYLILGLISILLLLKGTNNFNNINTLEEVSKNLSTELMGVVIVFLFVEFFFIWKNEDDEKMDRLGRYLLKVEKEEYSTVFKRKSGKYNTEFYNYFDERIRRANYDIYVTGEGFDGNSEEGRKIAENYIAAFEFALRKGVNVVRVQTKSFISVFWNEQLRLLLKKYPQNFHLYLSNNTEDRGSLCSIDCTDEINNVSEFMLSVPRTIGISQSNLAGLAVFIDRDQQLATDIKNMIYTETTNEKASVKITLNNFDIRMSNNNLYFAYGSNLLESRIKSRCPSARKLELEAFIDDYKLVFNRIGDYEKAGVASIVPALGERVYGAIYFITDKDLSELDKIEKGPEGKSYYRRKINIRTNDGQFLDCYSYLSYPTGDYKPTEKYLNWIIEGAIECNFPTNYVEYLKSIESI